MKNRVLVGIYCILICISFSGCTNDKEKSTNINNTSKVKETEEVVDASVSLSREENKTCMEVEMREKAAASGGSETWRKGEEISFIIKSSESAEIEIGILPVLENGDYGEILGQVCEVDEEEKKVSIKVPADGEYGICFINKEDKSVSLQVEVNKVLESAFI